MGDKDSGVHLIIASTINTTWPTHVFDSPFEWSVSVIKRASKNFSFFMVMALNTFSHASQPHLCRVFVDEPQCATNTMCCCAALAFSIQCPLVGPCILTMFGASSVGDKRKGLPGPGGSWRGCFTYVRFCLIRKGIIHVRRHHGVIETSFVWTLQHNQLHMWHTELKLWLLMHIDTDAAVGDNCICL